MLLRVFDRMAFGGVLMILIGVVGGFLTSGVTQALLLATLVPMGFFFAATGLALRVRGRRSLTRVMAEVHSDG
jgi:hypothetical protein